MTGGFPIVDELGCVVTAKVVDGGATVDVLREVDPALEAEPPFIPMRVAQRRMKPK